MSITAKAYAPIPTGPATPAPVVNIFTNLTVGQRQDRVVLFIENQLSAPIQNIPKGPQANLVCLIKAFCEGVNALFRQKKVGVDDILLTDAQLIEAFGTNFGPMLQQFYLLASAFNVGASEGQKIDVTPWCDYTVNPDGSGTYNGPAA